MHTNRPGSLSGWARCTQSLWSRGQSVQRWDSTSPESTSCWQHRGTAPSPTAALLSERLWQRGGWSLWRAGETGELSLKRQCLLSHVISESQEHLLNPVGFILKKPQMSLTEVTVVKLAWLHPDSWAGAEVDSETDHVVQLEVWKGLRDVTASGRHPNAPWYVLPGVPAPRPRRTRTRNGDIYSLYPFSCLFCFSF